MENGGRGKEERMKGAGEEEEMNRLNKKKVKKNKIVSIRSLGGKKIVSYTVLSLSKSFYSRKIENNFYYGV